MLNDADFYRYEHKVIYAAIGRLINSGRPRRRDGLRRTDRDRQGRRMRRPGHLNALAQSVPTAANLRRYSE
ncbi:DnaB-like helicase N-terminal domain-containing protein, partial [Klebsiella aerogenes]|uniref:DnaB-like helicase N-terminal domain-containing protein n=1 Tax=Klebsiella aerogenes TaxID=548 RepID=UPI003C6DA796